MGAQRAAADHYARTAPAAIPVIRVVPAGSGHSTIATFSNTGSGKGPGGSTVATFTSGSGGSGNTVVTFKGDKVVRENRPTTVANAHSTPRPPQATHKPASKSDKPPNDQPIVAVRHVGDPSPLDPKPDEPFMGPPAPAPEPVVASKPALTTPQIRNAFAGLGGAPKSTIEPSAMYAHASSPSR
jgi:hypothetical protein